MGRYKAGILMGLTLVAAGFAVALMPGLAAADSIVPSVFSATGPTGFTATVDKTVTINAGPPTTSLVDVFLLSDTTGSMSDVITAVRTSAGAIAAAVAPLGDVAIGVGEYKDKTTAGDPFDFRVNTPVTKILADVTTGLAAWVASGGGDTPEQGLYALDQLAKKLPGDAGPAPGFRPGAKDVIVWFADAPSHDPSGPTGATLGGTIADLVAAGDLVIGLNITHFGQSADPTMASVVGGVPGSQEFAGLVDPSTIAGIISPLITEAFANYSSVCLDLSEVPAGVSATSSACINGVFDRSVARDFLFTVSFTDLVAGVHSFNIYATVDGGRVAVEEDTITSTAPEPASLLLVAGGLLALGVLGRKRGASR